MRVLLFALIAVAAICPVSSAQADVEVAKARAKAALDLAVRQRERDEIAAAKSRACESLKKMCSERSRGEYEDCLTDLNAAATKALKEKLPLFVWVGMTCDKDVRAAFPTAIHVHVDSMNGATYPRLVISSKGETWRILKSELGKQVIEPIRQWLTPPAPRPQLMTSIVWQAPAVCVT